MQTAETDLSGLSGLSDLSDLSDWKSRRRELGAGRLPSVWCVPWALGGLLFAAGFVAAQSAAGGVGVAAAPVTAESLEALRKQASESTELSADVKQRLDASCELALDGLQRITELNELARQFKRDTDELQRRTAALRRRLADLEREAPAPPTDLKLPQLEQEVARREVGLNELKAALAEAE